MLRLVSLICLLAAFVSGWNFSPLPPTVEAYTSLVPVLANPLETQLLNGSVAGSYWMSAFVTASNGHEYLVLSHTLITGPQNYYRGSIFDITTSTYWQFFEPVDTVVPDADLLKISLGNYTLEALSPDNVSELHTSLIHSSNGFDLTVKSNHPILYNMGSGIFNFGTGVTYEWGMPSGLTEGTLTINNKLLTIIPEKSFTWYDRQWGTGDPTTGNWTWFELHFPGDVKASIWAWDNATPEQFVRAATLLYPDGVTKIVPFELTTDYENAWLSTKSGNLYPQKWTLKFVDGSKIQIESVFGDQEIVGLDFSSSTYEGFVKVSGVFDKHSVTGKAFGLVEMERFVK